MTARGPAPTSGIARSGHHPGASGFHQGGQTGHGGHLVLEHAGHLWGVDCGAVTLLARQADGGDHQATDPEGGSAGAGKGGDHRAVLLRVPGGDLAPGRVLAMVPDLEVRPAPGCLRRFWPEAAAGLAVYRGRPLVVIDPGEPPRSLLRRDAAGSPPAA